MSSLIHSGLRDFHPSSLPAQAGHPSLLERVTDTLRSPAPGTWREMVCRRF